MAVGPGKFNSMLKCTAASPSDPIFPPTFYPMDIMPLSFAKPKIAALKLFE